jgi:hypothetical protein
MCVPSTNTHSVGDSRSTHPSKGLNAVDDTNQACSVMYLHGCEQYLALATQLAMTASHILTLRDIAPTPMKPSWVI